MKKRTNFKMHQWLCSLLFVFCSFSIFAQTTVSGTIIGPDNEPLIGATVLAKGTATGTTTDIDGSFMLKVPEDIKTIVVSYTGFTSQEIDITENSKFSISLEESSALLSEIVVVGYGQTQKSVLTGAVSSVNVAELEDRGPGQLQSSIQGKNAGIAITPSSGAPDAGFKVRIRGTGSNGNNEPLYIVDGMRTDDISFLEANQIASMEILKDAASAAIYGAEAANGVVLITTKKGSASESSIRYDLQYGIQSYRGNMELMDANQWSKYLSDAGVDTIDVSNATTTNWIDEIFETAPMQRHSLSFLGGNDKTTYSVQGSYFDQAGILGGKERSNFKRISTKLGLETQAKDWLKVGVDICYTNSTSRGLSGSLDDVGIGGLISSAILMDPTTPVTYGSDVPDFVQALDQEIVRKDENGNIYGLSNIVDGEIYNPLLALDLQQGDGAKSNRLFSTVYGTIDFTENLSFTSRIGVDSDNGTYHLWTPSFYATATRTSTVASATRNSYNSFNWQIENFATYKIGFGNNKITLLAGQSAYQESMQTFNATASGLAAEINELSYIDGSEQSSNIIGGQTVQKLASYFGRANFEIANKYLLSASVRTDGSSLFPEGKQWGVFPAVSVGYILSREDFFPTDGILNFVKLRASWGQNGSLSNVGPGAWKSGINFLYSYADAEGNFITAAEPGVLENPDLTWETSEQIDLGIDFGFFDDRLSLSVDYYNKQTKDLLNTGIIPGFVGNAAPVVNLGDVSNKGFEFETSYRNRDNALKYQISANFATLKNEVTKLDENLEFASASGAANVGTAWTPSSFEEGQPAWYFRGYQTNGLADDGTVNIVDVNGDGEITPDDHTFIGNPHPKLVYGGAINLKYNQFDFTLFLQGQSGNDILMGFNRTDRGTVNRPTVFLEDNFFAPSVSSNGYNSDMMVFDGSFMRIKQIQLGYNFGNNILKSTNFLDRVRVYVSLEDYFTFTKYPGLDPEIGSKFNDVVGIDRGNYPIAGRIMFGASVKL